MTVLVRDILNRLDARYPFAWAVPEDRVGLQLGHPEAPVRCILVALEANEEVVAEAQAQGAQLLLTHHPLIYRPLPELREDQGLGRLVAGLIRAGLAVVACHTNLDLAPGGVNDYLAQLLELEEVKVFSGVGREPCFKLTTFVPLGYEDRVRQALFDDRIGVIGAYSHCSFGCRGQGTYLPQEGAKPFRGEAMKLSRAEETRLEVLVPASRLEKALARLKAAHPYEEVAYDVYPLHNSGAKLGFGRLGHWSRPRSFSEAIRKIKELFAVPTVKVWGRPPAEVARVAVSGGSGGETVTAALAQGAQIFLTGEVRHHQVNIAQWRDFAVLEVGHFESEVVFMSEWARQLEELFQDLPEPVQVRVSQVTGVPVTYL